MTEETKTQKPWFYNDPDRFDDKFAFVWSWVMSLATYVLIVGGIATGHGNWVWAGIVCSFLQYLLVKSQVPPGKRYYENDDPTQ